ncbi:MAG: hypothetical protein Q9208_005387 [Pyrenodesmia sp. 3 TL-2023]
MNHEPRASTSDIPSSSHHSDHATTLYSSQAEAAATASHEEPQQRAKSSQKVYKTRFFDHLIRNLDIMIYAEFCSLFTFVVRALNHWFYFTPTPFISPIVTWSRPHVIVIFVLNILWLLIHASSTPPTAGEAVREYLHGGLLVDFVGQKSPVSRWRLAGSDLLVFALQLVMLGVTAEKKKLDAPEGDGASREEEGQDHDAEERGTRRSQEGSEGIELRFLRPASEEQTDGEQDAEGKDLLEETQEATASEHPGDAFYSGQHIIASIHIADTIRGRWGQTSLAKTGNSGNESMAAAATAELARRRFRFRIRIGGRDYGS